MIQYLDYYAVDGVSQSNKARFSFICSKPERQRRRASCGNELRRYATHIEGVRIIRKKLKKNKNNGSTEQNNKNDIHYCPK